MDVMMMRESDLVSASVRIFALYVTIIKLIIITSFGSFHRVLICASGILVADGRH